MARSAGRFHTSTWYCLVMFLFPLISISHADAYEQSEQEKRLEEKAENKAVALHKTDTLNLMLYTFLLILTVCTVWFSKHHRLRFVHETGLTLTYGLIVGFLIWVTSSGDLPKTSLTVVLANESSAQKKTSAPDYLRFLYPYSSWSNVSPTVSPRDDNRPTILRYKYEGEERQMKGFQDDGDLIQSKATFDPEVFFNMVLPPIMFNAGYSLKRRHFFRNIGSILAFAIAGTTVSCVIVGFVIYAVTYWANIYSFTLNESMLFGAMVSATDPVTVLAIFNDLQVENDLFALVFGESALNDATAIVLCRTIEEYSSSAAGGGAFSTIDSAALFRSFGTFIGVFLGSVGLGAFCGCCAALLTKFTKIRDFPVLETSLFVLISYMSFLASEACDMTGVVSALFCGISQAHYTYNNLSEESKKRTKQFFELLNFLAESFIFTYIGVSMFTSRNHAFNILFILTAFVAIAIGRAAFIYPFSFVLNLKRRPKIPTRYQHMMMFAGLRGAVAFALAIRNTSTKERSLMYTATALIVILTVIINGGLSVQVIDWLKIRHGSDHDVELQPQTQTPPPPAPTDRLTAHNPWDKSFLPRQWYNFDRRIIYVLRMGIVRYTTVIRYCAQRLEPAETSTLGWKNPLEASARQQKLRAAGGYTRFLKPLLTNSRPTLLDTAPQCCLPLARVLTTTEQLLSGGPNERGTHSRGSSGDNIFPDAEAMFGNGISGEPAVETITGSSA